MTFIVCCWRVLILRWALREIDPMHPDLPAIQSELEWRRRYLRGFF